TTAYSYFENGTPKSLTDPNGNLTRWTIDIQGRVTSKSFADNSQMTFNYENTTSRLVSVTDALNQTRRYGYTLDGRLASVAYLNAANSTPSVAYFYDAYFPRLSGTNDQATGATAYTYVPLGMPGALRLQTEARTVPNVGISYNYDAAGRLVARSI